MGSFQKYSIRSFESASGAIGMEWHELRLTQNRAHQRAQPVPRTKRSPGIPFSVSATARPFWFFFQKKGGAVESGLR
jgi:hypothetical protein